ncbi:hypothetical protein DSECCO2_427850 [anaerobic digester metagenome]|jgi:hypothetical protein|uniref:Type I-B CRISPR-associated protein Cas8b1/Cst1 n=1 Tax=Methanobacterium subterraneum TaxID=59277 RepID=A0A2H4VNA6_9EURY|nr:hypothetical protein [Methanobacterium subterraneum]AUB59562.1 hypothetical protein BK009_02030 [Methanobacterium subterraneum]
MKEITFYSTNNAWTNNGLVTMAQIMENFEEKVDVMWSDDNISFKSVDKPITDYIAQAMQILAGKGTYNFSTTFKLLNNNDELGSSYQPPKEYPTQKGEAKEEIIVITDNEREFLKKKKFDNKKKQQVWKMRMSYFGKDDKSYLDLGINLKDNSSFKRLISFENGKNTCPLCGMSSKTMEDVKNFFNPLFGEHHNNEIDGVGATRKKAKICPKCVILSYFALFDYYIPFYRTKGNKGVSYLSIPNTLELGILRKVFNNLSLKGQFIDFSDAFCTSYGTNIKNLSSTSKSASLITLLHNIKNKYHSEDEIEELTMSFEPIEKEEFKEINEWLIISSNNRIIHMDSNEKIYNILEPFKDPKNNLDVYLVPHFLNSLSFSIFNENDVEKFFNGILTLDPKKISEGLFRIAKESISNLNKIRVKYHAQNSSPLYLFTEIFLEKIMGESTMLDDNLKDACKSIGKTIGRGFSEDVGMLTKFAYSSGPEEFKKALEDASFRLAKISALDNKKSFYLDANHLETLMNSIDQNNFSDMKTYFVSFMSAYVLSENYRKKQRKE